MKGGDLVAQGGFGCVFRPNLPCPGEKTRTPKTISKVLAIHDAHKELGETANIDKIDPTFKYHLPTPNLCGYQPINDYEPGMENCRIRQKVHPDRLALLQYKDGGLSLDKFNETHAIDTVDKLKTFWREFYALFVGLDEMSQMQYTHSDIKAENIVIDPQTYNINFIDFGLASYYSQVIDDPRLQSKYESGYFVYPFEAVLLSDVVYNVVSRNHIDFAIFTKQLYTKRGADQADKLFTTKSLYRPTWNENYRRYVRDLIKMDRENIAGSILYKLDIFGIGIVMAECLSKMIYEINKAKRANDETTNIFRALGVILNGTTHSYHGDRISPGEARHLYETTVLPLVGEKPMHTVDRVVRMGPGSGAAAAAAAGAEGISDKDVFSPKRSQVMPVAAVVDSGDISFVLSDDDELKSIQDKLGKFEIFSPTFKRKTPTESMLRKKGGSKKRRKSKRINKNKNKNKTKTKTKTKRKITHKRKIR
jgi:serine/threonine protein kinase